MASCATGCRSALNRLAAPIGGQQWPPAAEAFVRVRAVGGDR
ncbi:hypothetical protein ACWC9T_42060 [Kitasatospora sp. NPDC001159]